MDTEEIDRRVMAFVQTLDQGIREHARRHRDPEPASVRDLKYARG